MSCRKQCGNARNAMRNGKRDFCGDLVLKKSRPFCRFG